MREGFQKVPIRSLRGVFIPPWRLFVCWPSIKPNRSKGGNGIVGVRVSTLFGLKKWDDSHWEGEEVRSGNFK
jgi:hypothetical protein